MKKRRFVTRKKVRLTELDHDSENWHWIYIESKSVNETSFALFRAYHKFHNNNPAHLDGGAGSDPAEIIHKESGERFLAVNYRGDIDGWENHLRRFCSQSDRRWAKLRNGNLELSDGTKWLESECDSFLVEQHVTWE